MELSICPTGNLYQTAQISANAKSYTFSIGIDSQLLHQSKIIPLSKLKPTDGWKKTNEPEDHLDLISEKILNCIVPKNILCFSYKDQSLAQRITDFSHSNIETLFEESIGIINSFPEDYEDPASQIYGINRANKYDLILVRHYLEHFATHKQLIKSLKELLTPRGFMYIEVPDTSVFLQREIPLYLWEQHRVFFTLTSLKISIKNEDLDILYAASIGRSIEPSLCMLTSRKNKHHQNLLAHIDQGYNTLTDEKINLHMINYKNAWEQFLEIQAENIFILGAGHNADRFVQFTECHETINSILDDDPKKQGLFIAKHKQHIEPTNVILNLKRPTVLIACHDRAFETMSKKILTYNSTAVVKNIFTIPV